MSGSMNILVTDDSPMIRSVIRGELEAGGYKVVEASDGYMALTRAAESAPLHLVTLDIEMPKLNGFETCRKLREERYARFFSPPPGQQHVPVIFVTGNDTLEDRQKGYQLGATDFIAKPFEKGDLLRAVNEILRPENRLQGLTALVVDDSAVSRKIVVEILTREGLHAIQARNGVQAFETLCNRMTEIDIVITDLIMPGMGGDELCRKVRNELDLQTLPVIVLTALSDRSQLIDMFRAGATDYLVKPFLKEELLARISVQLKRTQLRKRLEEKVLELKKLNRMKDGLLAVCSHDLRSPLNGVLGFTDLLLEKRALDAEDREFLLQIKASGEYLLGLVNDLLDLSKIQSDKTDLKKEETSVFQAAQTSVQALKRLAEVKRQQLELVRRLPDDAILGDRNSLIRAFNNLISNAIKFTPENGRVTVSLESGPPGFLAVSVADTGIGLSGDKIPHLFEPFTRTSQDGTGGEKGTGLGMSIVKEIVERHCGRIEVHSREGEGTCFRLLFPRREGTGEGGPVGPPPAETPTTTAGPRVPGGARFRILLAEDNPVNVRLATKILADAGHMVTVAENGLQAVTAARHEPFDLIFMDMQMPEMDGIQAARAIREAGRLSVPIVALTANSGEADREICLAAGMNDVLCKPFKPTELRARVDQWCTD